MNWRRLIFDIILVSTIFFLPWWVSVMLGVIAAFIFHDFYELVVVGVIIDSLYNASIPRFYHFQFVVSVSLVVIFILIQYIKPKLRFYTQN